MTSVEKLGYRPNLLAKSLATGRSKQLGLIIPDLRNPYFSEIFRAIDRACSADGFMVLFADSQTDPQHEARLVDQLLQIADAMILVAPRQSPDSLNELLSAGKPVVSIVGPVGSKLRNIAVDNLRGMRSLFEYLAGLGHTRGVYLGGPRESSQDLLRRQAIPHAAELGLHMTVVEAGSDVQDGRRATDDALSHDPTVLCGYNDLVALGAMSRLSELGVSVPEDLSLTGFDHIAFTQFTSPRLTTVETPQEELGSLAWREVQRLIQNEPAGDNVVLPTRLVIGGSTAEPPR